VLARYASIGLAPVAVIALAVGAACGLFNGLVVAKGRVQPLIATLAMMGIARGVAFSVSEKSILVNDPMLRALRAMDGFLSVPTLVWVVVVTGAVVWFRTTRQALHVFAIGGNEQTARLAGVATERIKISVYTVSGMLSGLAGIVLVIRSSSGVPLGGVGWELDSIASIVIGGTSLFGGEGRLLHAMAGVIVYQMIANVMNLAGLDPFYQNIVRAAVIILAVGVSILRQRNAGRRAIVGRK
jgi:ribose/xylose/arabinose/galactoside ABC-type transport system permease subunit